MSPTVSTYLARTADRGARTYPSCPGCGTKDNKWPRRDPPRVFEKIERPGYAFEVHATLNHAGPQASPIQIPAPRQMPRAWVISGPVDSHAEYYRDEYKFKLFFLFSCQSRPVINGDAFHILYIIFHGNSERERSAHNDRSIQFVRMTTAALNLTESFVF